MPQYEFRVPNTSAAVHVELDGDDEAWSEAIMLCGEMLRDVDGNLPAGTTWELTVCEAGRTVATVKIEARRHYDQKP